MEWLNSLPHWAHYAMIGGGALLMLFPDAKLGGLLDKAKALLPASGDHVCDCLQKVREQAIVPGKFDAERRNIVLVECDDIEREYKALQAMMEGKA